MKKAFFGVLIVTAVIVGDVSGGNGKANKVIKLWSNQPNIKIEVFLPKSKKESSGTGIIVCPGGGYGRVCIEKEGYAIAEWLNSNGVAAFVLSYHVNPEPNSFLHPWPMKDGRKAVSLVRSKADKFGIEPNHIGIMGFSAGGHLASTIGTHWQKPDQDDIVKGASCRPDFMVLIYPVITFDKSLCHMGSRENLIGKDANESLVNEFSNELQVDTNTPPTFLVHATNDKAVPVENSLMFYSALKKAGVNTEMHIFSRGGHGFGSGYSSGKVCDWRPTCAEWMKDLKLIK